MDILALVIALISLIVASIAYWRSGGRRDVALLRREFDGFRAREQEWRENISRSVAQAYERSRQRLAASRESLRRQSEEAVEDLERQIKRAQEQLETLARRLEKSAHAAVDATVEARQAVERAIAERVRHIEARAIILQVKGKTSRAVHATKRKDFARADALLTEGAELLRNAREVLGNDHAYEHLIETMKAALRDATSAVRAQAQNVQQQIERVLTDADRLVGSLESDEEQAEKRAAP